MMKMYQIVKKSSIMALVAMIAVSPMLATPKTDVKSGNPAETMKQIRKRLVTLPYYGVFDNLAYKYEDGVVTLSGQVVRPTTKSDAARGVERVAGVDQVVNQIEVLPLSPAEDQVRIATYRKVYSQPGLDRLANQAVPPIHIVVKRGLV